MLKKNYRLSKSKDIETVSLRGRSFFNPLFVVKHLPANTSQPRFNIITSVRVSKKAVERNRLKRIVREALRHNLSQFKPGNYVIIVKRSAVLKPAGEIRQSLIRLLSSVKLLNIESNNAQNS
jgi:ribonuclease P protein component